MKRILMLAMACVCPSGWLVGQGIISPGQAPRLETGANTSTSALIGAAPRLGSATGRTGVVNVPIDVTGNSVVPIQMVRQQVVAPRQPSLLDRLRQLLPFAARTGATVVAPEAVMIHDNLPGVTIK